MTRGFDYLGRRLAAIALAAVTLLSQGCGAATPKRSLRVVATTTVPTTTVPTTTVPTTVAPTGAGSTTTPTTGPARTTATTAHGVGASTTVAHAPTTSRPTTSTLAAGCSSLPGRMAATGGGSQLITVVAPSTTAMTATLTLWQRSGTCWTAAGGPWAAWLGYNGAAANKMEGDGKTPLGLFSIGSTFYGTAPNPGVHGTYHNLVCGDWWDENPTSADYNTFQHVSPCSTTNPFGGGSEALWLQTTAYASFAVIEYNTSPIVKGKGSAIFLHVSLGHGTNGCVSLPSPDLVATLRWLQPGASPHIAIGTSGTIQSL